MLSEVSNDPPIQESRAAAEDNLNSEVNSTDKGIQALQNEKDRVARQKEKLKEQLRFFEDVTLADVTIDDSGIIGCSHRRDDISQFGSICSRRRRTKNWKSSSGILYRV